jgi:hypothetical protein
MPVYQGNKLILLCRIAHHKHCLTVCHKMLASIVVLFAQTSEICIIKKPRTLKKKARFSTAEKGNNFSSCMMNYTDKQFIISNAFTESEKCRCKCSRTSWDFDITEEGYEVRQ